MKESKRSKKAFIISFSLLVAVLIIFIVFRALMVSTLPKLYLTNKYDDMNYEQIEPVSYNPNKIDKNLFFLEEVYIRIYPQQWRFKYNDKEFNVEFGKMHFADDYQLEELEALCTEYLQENVDDNIQGVIIYSDTIYSSHALFEEDSTDKYKITYDDNILWTSENIEEYINAYINRNYQTNYCPVYIYYDNTSAEIISKEMSSTFPNLSNYYLIKLNGTPLTLERYGNQCAFNELYRQEAYGYMPSEYVKENIINETEIKDKKIVTEN